MADLIPKGTTNNPSTAPPNIIPPLLDANMKPFALAPSSGRNTSTAKASTLTSCNDENKLCMNSNIVTNAIASIMLGINSKVAKEITIPD